MIISEKIKSVKLESVNNKVRQKYWSIQYRFSSISELRSVDNCLKMTAYDDVIGGDESKAAFYDQQSTLYCLSSLDKCLRRKLVFAVRENEKFSEDCRA